MGEKLGDIDGKNDGEYVGDLVEGRDVGGLEEGMGVGSNVAGESNIIARRLTLPGRQLSL